MNLKHPYEVIIQHSVATTGCFQRGRELLCPVLLEGDVMMADE